MRRQRLWFRLLGPAPEHDQVATALALALLFVWRGARYLPRRRCGAVSSQVTCVFDPLNQEWLAVCREIERVDRQLLLPQMKRRPHIQKVSPGISPGIGQNDDSLLEYRHELMTLRDSIQQIDKLASQVAMLA